MNALRRHTLFLNLLIMVCLISAGISPACKFINGQASSLIEICTTYGIKKIPAPQGFAAADIQQQNENHDQQAIDQCVFCLNAQTHKMALGGLPAAPTGQEYLSAAYITSDTPTRTDLNDTLRPEARAPPALS